MAIVLLVIIFTMIPVSIGESERDRLEVAITKIDRAISFATNESILRNVIVRLRIDLDADPMDYSVEYGQRADLVLPQSRDLSNLSLKDRLNELEKVKKLDLQFSAVDEFTSSKEPLPEGINIYGLGTSYSQKLIIEGSLNIYFYPTGEKDSAILFFHTSEEIATLTISPFENKTVDKFIPFSESELANLDYTLENKAKDIFEKWLKE